MEINMKRGIVLGVLVIGVVALGTMQWNSATARKVVSSATSVQGQTVTSNRGGGQSPSDLSGSLSGDEIAESRRHAVDGMLRDERTVLERRLASQEEVVKEKGAALGKFVRSYGVASNSSDRSDRAKPELIPAKRITEVGGYFDMKKEYELEKKNLDRMKARLEELKE